MCSRRSPRVSAPCSSTVGRTFPIVWSGPWCRYRYALIRSAASTTTACPGSFQGFRCRSLIRASVSNAISAQLSMLKGSKQAVAGDALVKLAGFAPPMLLSLGSRLAARTPQRALQTVTTNVPGPQYPLYVVGRRMVYSYPYVPIMGSVRISIAIFSYCGDSSSASPATTTRSPTSTCFATASRRGCVSWWSRPAARRRTPHGLAASEGDERHARAPRRPTVRQPRAPERGDERGTALGMAAMTPLAARDDRR